MTVGFVPLGMLVAMPAVSDWSDDRLNIWWRYLIDIEQFKGGNGTLGDASGLGAARITQPANNATVSGIFALAVDAGVDGTLGRVDLYRDGTYYASDMLAAFRFALDTSGLLGAHTLVAKAYELQSGAEISSAPITFNVRGRTINGMVITNSAPLRHVRGRLLEVILGYQPGGICKFYLMVVVCPRTRMRASGTCSAVQIGRAV